MLHCFCLVSVLSYWCNVLCHVTVAVIWSQSPLFLARRQCLFRFSHFKYCNKQPLFYEHQLLVICLTLLVIWGQPGQGCWRCSLMSPATQRSWKMPQMHTSPSYKVCLCCSKYLKRTSKVQCCPSMGQSTQTHAAQSSIVQSNSTLFWF